ncbi:exonuclease domain-containing protein [Rummeliibacillus sp. JY-2-4R]
MDFIAISIDTANQWRDSICSIGLIKVVQNEITDSLFTYINPEQSFDEYHTSQHGITEDMVQHSPTFKEFYPILNEWLTNQTVISYYRAFDYAVLEESCMSINQLMPYCDFGCTLSFSKTKMTNQKYFSIHTLANHYGISLELSKSEIIAQLVLHFEKYIDGFNIHDLTKSKMITLSNSTYIPSTTYFKGKMIVITGGLEGLTRSMAAKKIQSLGGVFSNSLNTHTDILIVSNSSWNNLSLGHKSSKLLKAEQLMKDGHSIEIIQEERIKNYFK